MAAGAGRGLDHTVHAVRDLDAAAELYRRLGFTVGVRNKHPWGTHNHIVQLPGYFVELLTFAEPDKLGTDGFSTLFAAYNRDFIARGEGLSLQVLETSDAEADATAFRAAGVANSEAMRFEREGRRPDDSTVRVGFSLAFARDKNTRDIHFCVCQQHFPENFWSPAFQQHANGVTGIAGIVMVAHEPERHQDFMETFVGASAAVIDSNVTIETPRGTIDILTPVAFSSRYGVQPPDTARGARLAALRFTVGEAGKAQVVGSADAMGAVLVFEAGR